MDFKFYFVDSLLSNTTLTKTITLEDYLPESLSSNYSIEDDIPHMQAFGMIQSTFPYHYTAENLDSYCFLYTEQGTGTITYCDQIYELSPGTLIFIDCKLTHHIEIKHSPWHYKVFFMKGTTFHYLYQTITEDNNFVHRFSLDSSIYRGIQNLYNQLAKKKTCTLFHMKYILNLLFDIAIDTQKNSDKETSLPDYLKRIKLLLDNDFTRNITLDDLEQQFHISKYRICREFTKQFGISPILYVNTKRIELAKDELIYTEKRINEIGHFVGFENTNHFIRLFKQQTGVTPLTYRKQSPVLT